MVAANTRVAPVAVETSTDIQWSCCNCGCYLCIRSRLRTARVRSGGWHQPNVNGAHLARFIGSLGASIRAISCFGGFGLVRFWCLHCRTPSRPVGKHV